MICDQVMIYDLESLYHDGIKGAPLSYSDQLTSAHASVLTHSSHCTPILHPDTTVLILPHTLLFKSSPNIVVFRQSLQVYRLHDITLHGAVIVLLQGEPQHFHNHDGNDKASHRPHNDIAPHFMAQSLFFPEKTSLNASTSTATTMPQHSS